MGGERVKFGRESITLLQNNAKEKIYMGSVVEPLGPKLCCGAGARDVIGHFGSDSKAPETK